MRVFNHQLFVSFQNFCSTDPATELDPQITLGGTWSGSGIINSATGLFDPSMAEPGQYYIYWETPAGCNDSVLVSVEEFSPAQIDNLLAHYCVLDQIYGFDVSPDGGTYQGLISSNSFNPSILGAGDYQVIYTYDGPYCIATSDTANFTIHPALANTLSASDLTLCQDQQVTITATTSGGYPGSGGYSYQWSTGGQAFNSTTTALTSSQYIQVSINDGCGPSISDSIYIEVLPPIETTVATSDTLCVGEAGFASVAVSPAGGDYQISWNNTIAPILNAQAGTSWQLVVLDNTTGCETTPQTVIIPSYPNVNANFIVTPNSACISFADASSVNIIDLSQNATTGMWDFGNGINQAYAPGQNLTQNFASPGNYQINLFVMNDAGCEDTSSYSFCVLPEIPVFVPDIFSPNDDGNNDVLFVRGNGIARIDFRIYNRWGEEVFATTDPTKGWDGQLRGSPSQSGSYFYTLKVRLSNDTPLTLTGEVILVR
jgi:gliding motility-associated-like protein